MTTETAAFVVASPSDKSEKQIDESKQPVIIVPLKELSLPWHSVALLVAFVAFSVATFPSMKSLDQAATLSTFTSRVFPQYISLKQLAYIRLFVALSIWWTSFHTAFISKGWEQSVSYLPKSKLIKTPIRMSGINTMYPMTSWTWNLLGLSYSVNAYISLRAAYEPYYDPPAWLLRTALLLFEVAAPTTCLVAVVVRYAIWPRVLQVTGDTTLLRHPRNIMMHNVNAVYSLMEALLLGGIPVRRLDFAVAPLFGVAYVTFLWSVTHRWVDMAKYGPQVLYFFLDPTLGWITTKALVALLVVLIVFYALFASIDGLLQTLGCHGYLLAHCAAVVLISSVICRVRD